MKTKEHLSDEEIIELYWIRNEKAIDATDSKYGKYLYTIAYNIVHNHMDSEECVNDTYLGTWNRIPPERPNLLQVFLSRIMRNIAIDKFRQNTATKRVPSELQISLDELDECIADVSENERYLMDEIAKILNGFLQELNEQDEFIFVCRYYYSDRINAIAKMLKTSEKEVSRRLAALRKDLKQRLEKEGHYFEK
ncbi:MAG: sigma-70 family RNA polymerase sigma factor [Clostridia bacterium]|nr:sigma-70 family RNA polymerase sigma factor [Clostridia bacterium]